MTKTEMQRKEFTADLSGVRLETEEAFVKMEEYIRSEIEVIKTDPKLGVEYLYKTGMYDKQGRIKKEFV